MEDLQEEPPPGYPDNTFVTYRGMRIFYTYKQKRQEWLFLVTYVSAEAVSGYPTVCSGWFKNREEGLAWGKAIVDAARGEDAH